jgi:hypothetical protein
MDKRMTVSLPAEVGKLMKLEAVRIGTTLGNFVVTLFTEYQESGGEVDYEDQEYALKRKVVKSIGRMSDSQQREFALRCARRAFGYADEHDDRTVKALDSLGRWVDGKASREEMRAAHEPAAAAAGVAEDPLTAPQEFASLEGREFNEECLEHWKLDAAYFSAQAVKSATGPYSLKSALSVSEDSRNAAVWSRIAATGTNVSTDESRKQDMNEYLLQLSDIWSLTVNGGA